MRNRGEVKLLMRLISIPGRSGEENGIAQFIQEKLLEAGAPASAIRLDSAHKHSPIGGRVGNLILKLPGDKKLPRRLLMAHLDTVPICVRARPIRQGNVIRSADPATGLGGDDRAGVAVVLQTALRALKEKPHHPPLTFLWTVQEEVGLHGARYLKTSMLGHPQLAFNWDGSSPATITIGATGGYRMNIDVRGLASHAGNAPEAGISAVAIASLAISDLQQHGWHGQINHQGKSGTSNVGVIRGGDATNVVTDRVLVQAEARSHDPKFRKQIVAHIEKAFRAAVKQVRSSDGRIGQVNFDGRLDYESFKLKPNEPSVVAAESAIRSMGQNPLLAVANGGLDANWMVAHGIPVATLGCGQKNIHMVTEMLDVTEFQTACNIGWRLATSCSNVM